MQHLQLTKITSNGRISLGEAMTALGAQEGDHVQIFKDGCSVKIEKVHLHAQDGKPKDSGEALV